MPDFKEINPEQYFDQSKAITAQKTATISARPATAGEEISTIMKDGHVETKNIAKAGDFVVTNPDGERYIVAGDKFLKKYLPTDNPTIYKPNAGPVQAMPLTEDVKFKAPWGEEIAIKKGGVLVKYGPGDIAGIQPEEFRGTYSVIDQSKIAASAAQDVSNAGKTAGNDVAKGAAEATGKSAVKETAETIAKSAGNATTENGAKAATVVAAGLAEGGGTSVLRTVGRVAGRAAVPVTIAVGAAEAGYDVYKGDYRGATKSATGTAGALAGGVAGAEAGAALGSVVPGAGTLVGGVVGGIAGGIAGYYGGSKLGEKAYDVVKEGAVGARGELSKVYNWFAGGNEAPGASVPTADASNKSQVSVPAPGN